MSITFATLFDLWGGVGGEVDDLCKRPLAKPKSIIGMSGKIGKKKQKNYVLCYGESIDIYAPLDIMTIKYLN